MKTLDETIKGFECCEEINCAECPYANWDKKEWRCDPSDKDDDALYFLKNYKEMVDGFTGVIVQYKEIFKMIIDEAENENAR